MHWQGNGDPPQQVDPHTPYLIHILEKMSTLSHSSGRIEATLDHVSSRLEAGDARFQTIETKLDTMTGELAAVRARPAASPSKIEETRKVAELIIPAIKEAWPFLAVAGAGASKALGYDLSWLFGP